MLFSLLVYIYLLQARETDQPNLSVAVEYISMFHPNIPPILHMVNGYNAADTVVPSVVCNKLNIQNPSL